MSRKATITKERLIEGAMQVMRVSGSAKLTLEDVAKAAGVSKGAVLHYFPTKKQLILGLVNHHIETSDASVAKEAAKLGGGRDAYLKAYVNDAFRPDEDARILMVGVLAAATSDPELLSALQHVADQRRADLKKHYELPEKAAAIMLAADGYFLLQAMGLKPLDKKMTKSLQAYLLDLAKKA